MELSFGVLKSAVDMAQNGGQGKRADDVWKLARHAPI